MSRAKTHRDIYKEYFNVEFGPDMSVHHIDFDNTNNNIKNLILLPRELHNKYHAIITHLKGNGSGIINGDMRLYPSVLNKALCLKTLYLTLDEIEPWMQFDRNMRCNQYRRSINYKEIYPTIEIIPKCKKTCFIDKTLVIGDVAKQIIEQSEPTNTN